MHWQLHGNWIANAWQVHGNCMASAGNCIATARRAWQLVATLGGIAKAMKMQGKSTATTTTTTTTATSKCESKCSKYMASAWQLHGKSRQLHSNCAVRMASARQLHGNYLGGDSGFNPNLPLLIVLSFLRGGFHYDGTPEPATPCQF